jgi:hypothetical protein
MRGSAFERRLSRVEAATPAIRRPWEPSPERKAVIDRHLGALTPNEKVEFLNLLDKCEAGTLTEEDGARLRALWSKGDL